MVASTRQMLVQLLSAAAQTPRMRGNKAHAVGVCLCLYLYLYLYLCA